MNIYAGASTSGDPVYSETTTTYSFIGVQTAANHCLVYGTYTALMADTFGDGWTSGSILTISVDGEVVAVIQWTCATSGTYSCSQTFTIEAPAEWQ